MATVGIVLAIVVLITAIATIAAVRLINSVTKEREALTKENYQWRIEQIRQGNYNV